MHSHSRNTADCMGYEHLSRRRFLAIAGGATAAAILAACGGGVDTSTPTPAVSTAAAKPTAGSSGTAVSGTRAAGSVAATGSGATTISAGSATAVPQPAGNYNYPTALKKGVTLRYLELPQFRG